jgi:hypothetical protein
MPLLCGPTDNKPNASTFRPTSGFVVQIGIMAFNTSADSTLSTVLLANTGKTWFSRESEASSRGYLHF